MCGSLVTPCAALTTQLDVLEFEDASGANNPTSCATADLKAYFDLGPNHEWKCTANKGPVKKKVRCNIVCTNGQSNAWSVRPIKCKPKKVGEVPVAKVKPNKVDKVCF